MGGAPFARAHARGADATRRGRGDWNRTDWTPHGIRRPLRPGSTRTKLHLNLEHFSALRRLKSSFVTPALAGARLRRVVHPCCAPQVVGRPRAKIRILAMPRERRRPPQVPLGGLPGICAMRSENVA
jgi:hypothetical protein